MTDDPFRMEACAPCTGARLVATGLILLAAALLGAWLT